MIDIKEDYYILIRNKIIDNEIYEKVKDYSKERHKLLSYYDIGRLLSEAGSKYGENVIKEYSEKLALDIGKKYKERSLRNMRQFYNMFCDAKWQTAFAKLTWSHFLTVLPLDNENEISFYLTNAIDNNLTVRELKEIIKNKTYYRLPESIRSKQETIKDIQLKDTIKNPIIFYSDTSEIKEHALQMLILENIPYFLDELGESFYIC